jgi:hypothetical protein
MIRNFNELGGANGGEDYNELCDNVIKSSYRVYLMIISITLVFLNVFVYEKVQFFLPVVYEAADKYSWFSFVYFVYFLHCVVFINIVISIDVLPTISVLKLEGLVALLCRRMNEVTSGDQRENERRLDECIKFHVKVLK